MTCIFLSYTCHISLVGEQCFVCIGVSPYAKDVSLACMVRCVLAVSFFFDCLKELNVNSTYDRHFQPQINHMSYIISYTVTDISTVTSELIMIFASFNIAMHTTYAMNTTCRIEKNEIRAFKFWHGGIFQVYT